MKKQRKLNNIELRLRFDNLHITIEQIGHGIFHKSISRHCHGKNYYEAHFICGGKGALIVEDNTYPLKKGTIFMTGPNIIHEQLTDNADPMEEYCLGFYIKKDKNSVDSKASSALYNTHFWIGSDTGNYEKFFELIATESNERKIGFQNNIKNILSCIFVYLIRAYTNNAISLDISRSTPEDKRAIIIDNSFLYNYDTITRRSLAESLFLSERQLQRILIKEYGKTFSCLKREARLNKAKELLEKGKTIEETASLVGHSDVRSFIKLLDH